MATLDNCNVKGKFNFDKSLEKECIQDRTLNISFNRLLAKSEPQRELEGTRKRLSDNIVNKGEKKYIGDNISRPSHKNEKILSNFDVYMKNYNRRYSQKKGLSKLDCYYEKKVFDKFQNICEFAKKANYDKKRCKKLFYKKYGIGLISFSLLPVLGFIFPILFWNIKEGKALINFCSPESHSRSTSKKDHSTGCDYTPLAISEDAFIAIDRFNTVFFAITAIIYAAIIIYVFFKAMKYERLKAGKGKMSVKEHYSFCKNIFI